MTAFQLFIYLKKILRIKKTCSSEKLQSKLKLISPFCLILIFFSRKINPWLEWLRRYDWDELIIAHYGYWVTPRSILGFPLRWLVRGFCTQQCECHVPRVQLIAELIIKLYTCSYRHRGIQWKNWYLHDQSNIINICNVTLKWFFHRLFEKVGFPIIIGCFFYEEKHLLYK